MIHRFITKLALCDLALLNLTARCATSTSCQSLHKLFIPSQICQKQISTTAPVEKVTYSKEELLRLLSPFQYEITQKAGTEQPFTGKYLHNHENGIYQCILCKQDLFSSKTKYDSGSGWPSFFDTISNDKVKLVKDSSHGMVRTEVVCSNCNSHLGHVFDDGPEPTGQRYCMNSGSLHFEEEDKN